MLNAPQFTIQNLPNLQRRISEWGERESGRAGTAEYVTKESRRAGAASI